MKIGLICLTLRGIELRGIDSTSVYRVVCPFTPQIVDKIVAVIKRVRFLLDHSVCTAFY